MKKHFSNQKVKVTMLDDEEWEKITKKLAKSNMEIVGSLPIPNEVVEEIMKETP